MISRSIGASFTITFNSGWYPKKNDILELSNGVRAIVIKNPKRKWYKLLLQYISFGWYQAPYEYPIKIKAEVI